MSISSVSSFSDSIALMASTMKSQDIGMQIAVEVLKGYTDQQQQFAQALLQMMQASPSIDGTGQIIDIFA